MSTDLTPSNTDLVFVAAGAMFTTSLVIANETGVQHKNVLELIRDNARDLTDVGGVAFETQPFQTSGGTQRREVARLDEAAAALLMTYLRNSPVVKDFKKRLVAGFYAMRQQLAAQQPQELTEDEIVHQALAITARRVEALTARVAELEPKAEVADKLLDADGDLSVRDAAQSLTRAGIKVGQNRLFVVLEKQYGWIGRAGDQRYRVKQSAIESGYMSVLPQSHYHPRTGVLVLDPPQPRVTPKGLQRLLSDHGAES